MKIAQILLTYYQSIPWQPAILFDSQSSSHHSFHWSYFKSEHFYSLDFQDEYYLKYLPIYFNLLCFTVLEELLH